MYEFDTEDGKKTLAELFEGRSQLLAYNTRHGPTAIAPCSNLVVRHLISFLERAMSAAIECHRSCKLLS